MKNCPRAAFALIAALVCMSGAAGADSSDPYLEQQGFVRSGLAIGLALGPGGVAGNAGTAPSGTDASAEQRGGGGAVSLRVGTSAGPRLLWLVQLDTVQFLRSTKDEVANVQAVLSIAAQYYVREVVWLKLGVGSSSLTETFKDDMGATQRNRIEGLGFVGSGGYDLFRRGSWAVDLEASAGLAIYGDGVAAQFAIQLAANRY